MNLMKFQARSGFFEPLEMAKPWLVGVAQKPGASAAPKVWSLIHGPCPLTKKYDAEWACSMPTVPEAKAPLGSTQRPVQEILLTPPDAVALASWPTASAASRPFKAAVLPSGDRSSTPFILNSGQ